MIDLAQRQQHNDSSYTSTAGEEGSTPSHLLSILFLHEYWVYLQHSNVFGNPLLQHLDRQYGPILPDSQIMTRGSIEENQCFFRLLIR